MESKYIHNPSHLKIDLMLRGIKICTSVDNIEVLTGRSIGLTSRGLDVMLPNNVLVNVPYGDKFTEDSPYLIKQEEGQLYITDGSYNLPVEIVQKSGFYGKKTSSGVPMSSIATQHGSYVVITPTLKCDFLTESAKCKYCAIDLEKDLGKLKTYTVEDVLETVEAVLKDSTSSDIIYLSMGFSKEDDGGIALLTPYIRAIKKHFNCLVAVEAMPPKDNHWINETYAVGADSVLYNLEIFDKDLFETISPGRANLIGRDRYIEALKYATTVFPSGTVASHLVVGLEPPGSTVQGIDMLTSIGVVPILPIFRPSETWELRLDTISAEIVIPVYKHLYEKVKENDINMHWVRDISIVTTPIEGRFLVDEKPSVFNMVENFYRTKLGLKAAWGLSTLRRKLRVRGSYSDTSL